MAWHHGLSAMAELLVSNNLKFQLHKLKRSSIFLGNVYVALFLYSPLAVIELRSTEEKYLLT